MGTDHAGCRMMRKSPPLESRTSNGRLVKMSWLNVIALSSGEAVGRSLIYRLSGRSRHCNAKGLGKVEALGNNSIVGA